MKQNIIRLSVTAISAMAIVAIAILWSGSQHQTPATLTPEEISWIEFCKARGYDLHHPTREMEIEFLDTWAGSTEEEEALTRNGVPA